MKVESIFESACLRLAMPTWRQQLAPPVRPALLQPKHRSAWSVPCSLVDEGVQESFVRISGRHSTYGRTRAANRIWGHSPRAVCPEQVHTQSQSQDRDKAKISDEETRFGIP